MYMECFVCSGDEGCDEEGERGEKEAKISPRFEFTRLSELEKWQLFCSKKKSGVFVNIGMFDKKVWFVV